MFYSLFTNIDRFEIVHNQNWRVTRQITYLHWLKYPSDSISRYDKFLHTYPDSYQTWILFRQTAKDVTICERANRSTLRARNLFQNGERAWGWNFRDDRKTTDGREFGLKQRTFYNVFGQTRLSDHVLLLNADATAAFVANFKAFLCFSNFFPATSASAHAKLRGRKTVYA